MTVTTGVVLKLKVAGQNTIVYIQDIAKIIHGMDAFKLAIPEGGFSLQMKDLMDFLKKEFKFDTNGFPPAINNLTEDTSLTLHKLMFKLPPQTFNENDNKWVTSKKKDGSDIETQFGLSLTIAFDNRVHGGLFTDLTGVDLTNIIDLEAFTFSCYTEDFMDDFKDMTPGSPQIPARVETPTSVSTLPTGETTTPSKKEELGGTS